MQEMTHRAGTLDTDGRQPHSETDALWLDSFRKQSQRKTQSEIQG